LLPRLGLEEGYTVLEIGPGTGLFTVEAARAVGSEGKVYALDVNPAMLARVLMRAESMGLKNVAPLHGDARSIPLAPGSVHIAFMVGVLGEIPDRGLALREIYRVLKPGGLLSVTEMISDPHWLPGWYVSRLAIRCGFEPYWSEGEPWFRTHTFRKPVLGS
jgi:ubiquinone/menaquinone biosynthesis C-methylase UbiE